MDTSKWWIDLCKKHDHDKWSGGYEIIAECKKMLSSLDIESKNKAIDYLTEIAINKGNRFALALEILIDFNNYSSLDKLFLKALSLKDRFKQDEHYYIYLLKVIGANTTDNRLSLVNDYIFGSNFNLNQSLIHWALWPKNKDLFCKAYVRYLENDKTDEWAGSSITYAFMYHPDALNYLKGYMLKNKKNKLWIIMRDDLKSALKKDIWEIEYIGEIEKIIKNYPQQWRASIGFYRKFQTWFRSAATWD